MLLNHVYSRKLLLHHTSHFNFIHGSNLNSNASQPYIACFLLQLPFSRMSSTQTSNPSSSSSSSSLSSFVGAGGEEEVRPGRRLHVVTAFGKGKDVTLFFVHGSMAHHGQFQAQLQHFAQHPKVHKILAYDAYGCGQSHKPDDTDGSVYAEGELLKDLHALYACHSHQQTQPGSPREGNGGGDAHDGVNIVIGHSFGTNLAMRLAHETAHSYITVNASSTSTSSSSSLPSSSTPLEISKGTTPSSPSPSSSSSSSSTPPLIDGLVLIGTAPTRPGNSWLFYLPTFLLNALRAQIGAGFLQRAFHKETPPEILAAATRHNRSNPWHVIKPFYQQVEWGSRIPLQEGRIVAPTAVIVGETDGLTSVEASKEVADKIPGASFHLIKRASHMVMMEQPQEVNACIEALIERVLKEKQQQ